MRLYAILALTLAAPPALADRFCDDLWFSRNLEFDRAGFCFSSPLGKAMFDNTGCTGKDVTLDARAQNAVAMLLAQEKAWNCDVDTDATTLEIGGLDSRRAILDPPIADGDESACIGWLGERQPLMVARDDRSAVNGFIEQGDMVLFQYLPVEEWEFAVIYRDDKIVTTGWGRFDIGSGKYCEQIAG